MEGFRISHRLIALVPVALTFGIAIHARTHPQSFEPLSSTPEQDARVFAYVDVLRHTRAVVGEFGSRPDPNALRDIAREWVRGANDGRLRPLEPSFFGDSTQEGAKKSISLAQTAVVTGLGNIARREASHDAARAADDAMLGLEVASVLKYSDFASVVTSAMDSRRAYEVLQRVAPRLDLAQRQRLAARLRKLSAGGRSLDAIARRTRTQFFLHRQREGVEAVSIEEAGPLVSRESLQRRGEERAQALQSTLVASMDVEQPELAAEAQWAYRAHRDELRHADRVMRLLTK